MRAEPAEGYGGLGWDAGFGKLLQRGYGASSSSLLSWIAPDGAAHTLLATLHPGETSTAGVAYSRDSTYMRLKYSNPALCGELFYYRNATVDFPDGTIHTFQAASACDALEMKPASIADRFGNSLTFTSEASQTTLTDSQGRHHYLKTGALDPGDPSGNTWIKEIDLEAFDDPATPQEERATYTLTLKKRTIARSCKEEIPEECPGHRRGPATVWLLTSVTLPDGSAWTMLNGSEPGYNLDVDGICTTEPTMPKKRPGTLTPLQAPTGGTWTWTYGGWKNPAGDWGDYLIPNEIEIARESCGVTRRVVSDPSSGTAGTWKYTHDTWLLNSEVDPDSQESWTIVEAPDDDGNPNNNDQTKHYFRANYGGGSDVAWDYGCRIPVAATAPPRRRSSHPSTTTAASLRAP